MSKIFDILQPTLSECTSFIVDTTGPLYVTTSVAVPSNYMTLRSGYNGGLNTYFQRGNNFQIIKIGYVIPAPFIIYDESISPAKTATYEIWAYKHATLTYAQISVGEFIPQPNVSYDADLFVDVEDRFADQFQLTMKLVSNIGISMVGVDASLNGKKFYVHPYLQVQYNAVLTRYWDH